MSDWTGGDGSGHSVKIVVVQSTRNFGAGPTAGFTGGIQDAETGRVLGGGQQFKDEASAKTDTIARAKAAWPKVTIVP